MVTVTIGHGSTVVTFGPREVDGFSVEVAADGLAVTRAVYMAAGTLFELLATYFEDLASSWRGWEGERRWRSSESDLEIVATHQARGYCDFVVTIRDGPAFTWKVVVEELSVEVGEELSQLARSVRLWVDGSHRFP